MCLTLLLKQTHVHKERVIHTNEEKYKEEIKKLIEKEKNEERLKVIYTFTKTYLNQNKKEGK